MQQKATEQSKGFAAAGVSGSRAPEEGQNVEGTDGMKVYLAARYSRREELLRYAHELEEFTNATVTSRWLQGNHQVTDADLNGDSPSDTVERRARFAMEDWEDLVAADAVIAFTEKPRSASTRGGRHVELGAALALDKTVVVVGPRENVFCCLPHVEVFDTWLDCLHALVAEYETYEAEIGSPV